MAAGLTQERLVEKADLNIRTLQSIEAGEMNLLIATAIRLHGALGCSWGSLMDKPQDGTHDSGVSEFALLA